MTAPAGGRCSRRSFIKRAGIATAALATPGLLSACGTTVPIAIGPNGAKANPNLGPGNLPLARPDAPLTLPIYADNRPIASGLQPEKGPLQLYNWIDYINTDVINSFQRKYGVQVQTSTFNTIDEAIEKIDSRSVQFDVFVPELVYLEELVVGRILQPLNLSYIPNLKANVWKSLQSPWYDVGSRYTVPYTVYTTGIGWRTDMLPHFNPAKLANPWSALWTEGPKIGGRVGMLDDEHEALAMALLHLGHNDVNTSNAQAVDAARRAIQGLIGSTNLKFDTNEYQQLASGALWLHQAWSGDMATVNEYAPAGVKATAFAYWWPSDGRGPIDNDTFGVLRGAQNPVLAHLFLNHILDVKQAFLNFSYLGYQQPLDAMTPEAVVARKMIAPNLDNTLIRESQFKNGYVQAPMSEASQTLWENAWAAVQA